MAKDTTDEQMIPQETDQPKEKKQDDTIFFDLVILAYKRFLESCGREACSAVPEVHENGGYS